MTLRCFLAFIALAALSAQAQPAGAPPADGHVSEIQRNDVQLNDIHWNQGARDCSATPQPPLEVHSFDPSTYILRENLCSTFEAPFLYLLIGSRRALLIDSGDVADSHLVPLADKVLSLLPRSGDTHLPLLVAHTHRHLDHRAGDAQFQNLAAVEVVGFDLPSIQHFYGFSDWPRGVAQLDLGDRILDVLPTPGHNETEVSFYDRNTGLFFSGDFLMPGRLLIDDRAAARASAKRAADFASSHPIRYVLGGHIELDANHRTFPWESHFHPNERPLPMTRDDLLALPAALAEFNGFYSDNGRFVLMNATRVLAVQAALVILAIVVLVWAIVSRVRRRRRKKNKLEPGA